MNHVSLGRCNGNFWACMCVNQHIGFPCNGAALCVDNGERFCSPIFCQPHRCQAVGSFARLGNDNHQILCTENRVPIPEFGSNVNSNGNPCQLFNDILPNNTSVHGSTAGNNKNPVILFQSLRRNVAFFQVRQTVPNPRSNRCFDCSGLFVDFFQHEVSIAALFCCIHIPVRCFPFFLYFHAIGIIYFDTTVV